MGFRCLVRIKSPDPCEDDSHLLAGEVKMAFCSTNGPEDGTPWFVPPHEVRVTVVSDRVRIGRRSQYLNIV